MRESLVVVVACFSVVLGACQRSAIESGRVVPQVAPVDAKRVSFSPVDNDRLLVMEASGLVGVWDVPSGAPPQLFASIAAGAIDATFSPDGRSVVTVGTDGHVRWWGVDGQLKWVSQGKHQGPARAVAITPELIATGGEDGAIRLWQHDGTALGEVLNAHDGPVMSIAISPRGDLVTLGGDEVVRRWKPIGGAGAPAKFEPQILFRPEERSFPQGFVGLLRMDTSWGWDHSVGFSPKGDVIAAALFDRSLRFWNADGSPRGVIANPHQHRHVRALAFSPRGDSVASGGWDSTARLWNLDGSPRRGPINAHFNSVFSVAFSADGSRLATVGLASENFDSLVRIWKTDGSRELELPSGKHDPVTTVALANKAPVLAAAYAAGALRLWNLDGTPRGEPLVGHTSVTQALAVSTREDIVAAADIDGSVREWDLDGKPRGGALPFHRLSFGNLKLAFSPGGALAVGAGPFQLWDQNRLSWERPIRQADSIRAIAFSPRSDFIVTGSALGDIQVWNMDGSTRVGPLTQKSEYISALALAPAGDFFAAVVGASGTITLFNLDGTPRGTPLEGHFGAIRALEFSPSGRLASGGDDGTVRLWTLPSGQVETITVGLPITQLGYRGDVLWVRANTDYVFFYSPAGTLLATMLIRPDAALAYTPDGWYSGADPAYVRVFDSAGKPLAAAAAARHSAPSQVLQAIAGGRVTENGG